MLRSQYENTAVKSRVVHFVAENAEMRNCDYITRANRKVFTILWIGFKNCFQKPKQNQMYLSKVGYRVVQKKGNLKVRDNFTDTVLQYFKTTRKKC